MIIVILFLCQLSEKRNQNKYHKSDEKNCPQNTEYERAELFTSEFSSETDFHSGIRDNGYDDSRSGCESRERL